jgi:transposase
MNKQNNVLLTDEQRTHLDKMIRSGSRCARQLARARILLLADQSSGEHRTDRQIAEAVRVCPLTVSRVRHRFLEEGLDVALTEKPRPGHPPKITGEVEAQLITLACSDPPEGQARWTLRLLADRLVELECVSSLSHVAVGNALKKTNSSLGPSKAGV